MLTVIEGVDSSGKATHTENVKNILSAEGKNVRKITFPDYKSDSSALVKMYLAGDFGKNPGDVSAYAASAFYAVDRYASYKKDWGSFLHSGGIVVADRYVTSNMIHQAAKIKDKGEKDRFLDWVYDFEYVRLSLPVPDLVIFLDMPPETARMLMADRANKITNEAQKDIHESNARYLEESYENAFYVAEKFGWHTVHCVGEKLRPIEDISKEIVGIIKNGI